MGQYWKVVNLTKREYIHPHRLGAGMKLWEQLANAPGTSAALIVLCAAMPQPRGGGDLDLDENWHGPERTDMTGPGEMPEEYPAIAKRTIGRWAGDRIALIGDYAENSDLADTPIPASHIYSACAEGENDVDGMPVTTGHTPWTDVSADVGRVIEHELQGKYVGDGWRTFCRHEPNCTGVEAHYARSRAEKEQPA